MQAILTKFYGPTNTHGAKISAKCAAKRILVSYDHELDQEANHAAAAKQLAETLAWVGDAYGTLATGCLPSGDYCHVFVRGTE